MRFLNNLFWVLITVALLVIGYDVYQQEVFLHQAVPQVGQSERSFGHRPQLKAPNDASRMTQKRVTLRPVHYHGYFNAKNKAAYLALVQKDALRSINAERSKRGLPKLRLNAKLNRIATMRAQQADRNFNHYNRAGQVLACLDAVKLHIFNHYLLARMHLSECLSEQAGSFGSTAPEVTHTAVNGMIYHDARSHWGHRKILLDRKNSEIGIATYVDKKADNKIVIAYELYQ